MENLIRLKEEIKAKQEIADAAEMQIKFTLGDAEALIGLDGKPICTWKNQKSSRRDEDRLKEEQPEIAEKYMKTTESRVFRPVKPKKGKA